MKRKSTGRFTPMRIAENIMSIFINIPMLGLYRGVFVSTQHSQTTDIGILSKDIKEYRYATYSEFKTALQRGDWKVDPLWKHSLFAKDDKNYDTNYVHASIYVIDSIGYILTTYGLIRSRFLISSTIRELTR